MTRMLLMIVTLGMGFAPGPVRAQFGSPGSIVPADHPAHGWMQRLEQCGWNPGAPRRFPTRGWTRMEFATATRALVRELAGSSRAAAVGKTAGASAVGPGTTAAELEQLRRLSALPELDRLIGEFGVELNGLGVDLDRIEEGGGSLRGRISRLAAAMARFPRFPAAGPSRR